MDIEFLKPLTPHVFFSCTKNKALHNEITLMYTLQISCKDEVPWLVLLLHSFFMYLNGKN